MLDVLGDHGAVTVIIETRYGGVYEGGPWAAFDCEPEELPDGAFAGDPFCAGWWDRPSVLVGVGDSPNEALARLANLLACATVGLFQVGDLVTTAACTPDDWPRGGRGVVQAVAPVNGSTIELRPGFDCLVAFDDSSLVSMPERYLRATEPSKDVPKRRRRHR